jgi:hypothetical protein
VTIRITVVLEGNVSRLLVDGRLMGEDGAELLRVCEDIAGPKRVELGGVRFVDGPALGVLRQLQASGIPLQGATPYVRLLLGQAATDEGAGGR